MSEGLGKTGIYMRLSRDDEKSGESASIERQRIIVQNYVSERGGTVIEEYVDDGWSGTNFDRPDVKRLLEDARTGRIETIVVKDLSRFGRNYIQVGQYIDYIFPAYGIRFIAISDNVDTADRCSSAMDMMPIMNVFNEWHAANTSKKIRAVLEASQRSGKYTSWNYPYGYRAGADENRTAVIDGEAANVVKRIFALRAEGNSARAIAKILTDENIPNPATHYTRLDGKKRSAACSPYWCPKTVMWILTNPTYTGSTIQHKTTRVSYKNHKVINLPESEFIVKSNSHEAIIDERLWDRVQAVNKSLSRGKRDKSDKVHALSGLLVCADCGKKLKLKTYRSANNAVCRCGFLCRTYIDLGKKYCTSHAVSEAEIESLVLSDIHSMLSDASINRTKAREYFLRNRAKSGERNRSFLEGRLKICISRLAELDKLIQTAFEEKVLKKMPENLCAELCDKYQRERMTLEEEKIRIEEKLAESCNGEAEADEYVRKLKSYASCESISREMCLQLIKFITVGERNPSDGGRVVHIYYNFCKD